MLFRIDARIMEVIERFAQKLERNSGIHPFWVAALLGFGAVITFLVWSASYEQYRALVVFPGFPLVLIALGNLHSTPLQIKWARRDAVEGKANWLKAEFAFIELRIIAMLIAIILVVCRMFAIVREFEYPLAFMSLISLYSYFRACDGLPPGSERRTHRAFA
jgi:hypothetical protein